MKIFPETSTIPILTYLGIPYAQPPINNLRFKPPQPVEHYNRTYYARDFKAVCPQLESADGDQYDNRYRKISEDCLYLNIWVPETAVKARNFPVLVVLTGEDNYDWSSNRISGLDLAAEGIIVVTIQYRTNVFGWLTLETIEAPGNLALLDQLRAFKWIEENISKFGGDSSQLTLLGHGSVGTLSSFVHLLSHKTKSTFWCGCKLFLRVN